MAKAVALISGGMDSVTLAYVLKADGYDLHLLSFDYGQRHKKELEYSAGIAKLLGADWDLVVLMAAKEPFKDGETEADSFSSLLKGSSLTDATVEVPEGHYAEETMKATIVPNRNAIMLSIAYGVAVAEHADLVAFAAHSGDHAIYPDCRPEFVHMLEDTLKAGNLWAEPIPNLRGPLLTKTKAEIASLGAELGVPFEKTWSCYKGGKIHCGKCGTCVERKEAFQLAGVEDPTAYEDYDFAPPAPGSPEV